VVVVLEIERFKMGFRLLLTDMYVVEAVCIEGPLSIADKAD